MNSYRFFQVDVFTDRPFGGNPLAVFPEAEGLTTEEMQSLARELNLSETTFVLPPEVPEADFRVRIFTPATEIPFAGHRSSAPIGFWPIWVAWGFKNRSHELTLNWVQAYFRRICT